jgi:hypothetical protein
MEDTSRRLISRIVRFAITPFFFPLAGFNHIKSMAIDAHVDTMGVKMGPPTLPILGVAQPSSSEGGFGLDFSQRRPAASGPGHEQVS